MWSRNRVFQLGLAVSVTLAAAATATAQTMALSELYRQTHIHGIAVDIADPGYIFIATHHGLFRAAGNGVATRISEVQDFMGFSPHPKLPNQLFASGHPAAGGNLGFVASSDGGKTWQQLSPGVNGPVDFHQIAVSKADANVIYGAYGTLQVSLNGGKRWIDAGPLPSGLIALAASSKSTRTVYAARGTGLYVSVDGGLRWRALVEGVAATMVEVTAAGTVYAFVAGRGLLKGEEGPLSFTAVNADWGPRSIIHLASDPGNPDRLYAATDDSRVIASADGGRTWKPFGI